jgi:hypothetical protein
MYEDNEKLVTVEPIGSKKKGLYIPRGTDVEFVKVVDTDDITKSLIAFRYNDRTHVTLETNVAPKNKRKLKKQFNIFQNTMMANNPRLRRYHPNLLLRVYYRVYYFFKDRFGGKCE